MTDIVETDFIHDFIAKAIAELAKGVLHNLGNAMTPIGVRLAGLRDRLRCQGGHDEPGDPGLAECGAAGADRYSLGCDGSG